MRSVMITVINTKESVYTFFDRKSILTFTITYFLETGYAISTAFTYGLKDILTVFFFTLMVIIFRAIEQEYVIDVSAN